MFVCVFLTWFPIHTDYHTSTDITELRLLAVVVLELVGFVIDPDNRWWRFWFLLLHLNLLLIYEIDLDTQGAYISHLKTQYTSNILMFLENDVDKVHVNDVYE